MESWNYEPAKDLELTPVERARSLKRESGLWSSLGHLAWHAIARSYVTIYHRLRVEGKENLPARPPFVLIANHTSHLDAITLGAVVPARWRDHVFPVAAGDVFFETPGRSLFSSQMLNALPMWRKHCGPHALTELRLRLIGEPCGYILFPEGTRSRDGTLQPFKPGLGMILAGTEVPLVPCAIVGAAQAWPPNARWPRPRKLLLKIGTPLSFASTPNTRAGWQEIVRASEEAVRGLSSAGG